MDLEDLKESLERCREDLLTANSSLDERDRKR